MNGKHVLPPIAKKQENDTPILWRVGGYEMGKVSEEKGGIVLQVGSDLSKPVWPRCGSTRQLKGRSFRDVERELG